MVARVLMMLTLAVGLTTGLTACGNGAETSCSSTSQCTVTFDRTVSDAHVNILGVEIALVSATDTTVTLKVAGQEVTINNEQSASVGELTITLQSISEGQIVVQVSRA